VSADSALRVLLVEDDPDEVSLLLRGLSQEGFLVSAVENARAALHRLSLEPVDALVCDLNLPGDLRGSDLLRHVRLRPEPIGFVMLTGERDVATAVRAVKDGADEYLLKPSLPSQVAEAIHAAVRGRRKIAEQEERARRAEDAAFLAHYRTVRALVNSLETKDLYTRDHSRKVARYTVLMARELGMAPQRLRELRIAALLHDIGKIGVPLSILHKDGPLTDEEWEVIKRHTVDGAHIVGPLTQFLPEVREVVRHEHERWDGRGYPDGLAGTDIPLGSRLIMIADTYDAVCSDRAYRKARSRDTAIEIIRQGAGTQFDPHLVPVFLRTVHLFPDPAAERADVAPTPRLEDAAEAHGLA